MPLPPARRRERETDTGRARTVFLFLAVALIIGWLLVNLKFIFLPVLLALFGTSLLSPPVEWLRRRGLPRHLGLALILAATAALIWLSGRYFAGSLTAFSQGFPKYEERLTLLAGQARELTDHFPFLTADRLKSAVSGVSLAGLVGNTLNSFVTVVGYTLTTLLFLLYFLLAYPDIPAKLRRAFPDRRGPLFCRAFEGIGRQVQSYIWAKVASSLAAGLGVTLVCMFFKVDFALTWGVFAAALNFVPTIGALLSVLPPAAVAWLQPELGGASTALWLAAALTVIMILTGNVMEPLLLGRSVNLSPTASFLAMFLWGWLWGTVGMIIAVPAMAMVKFTCDNIDSLKPIGVLLSAEK